jgi:hypothetical protein
MKNKRTREEAMKAEQTARALRQTTEDRLNSMMRDLAQSILALKPKQRAK